MTVRVVREVNVTQTVGDDFDTAHAMSTLKHVMTWRHNTSSLAFRKASVNSSRPSDTHIYVSESGHGTVAVLLPGFAINW